MSDITNKKNEYQVPPVPGIASDDLSEGIEKSTYIENEKCEIVSVNNLDNARPLDPKSFPQQPRAGSNQVPATISNVQHLIDSYGIIVRYNTITKKLLITIPGYSGTPDNADNVAITQIISLATINGISIGHLQGYIETIGDRFQLNPVADWINSKTWDGVDRLRSIYDTLIEREDYPAELKNKLVYRWLLSAVAASLKSNGFKARGVLTLQGPQSIGKTSWINSLIPDSILRENTIKLDHHLDAGNKDSLITAISHWIVEIGELDSSFKKDIARLKGFLTSDRDKVRRPYGKANSEYPRRTVFCATVNDQNFLVDSTGNSRWWTIPLVKVNYQHGIDMQQLFAQLAVDFNRGEPWWLTSDEEKLLEIQNAGHRAISVIRDRVLDAVDLSKSKETNLPAMTPTQMLREIGISNPTNQQSKECAAVLRELFGESKRINGQNKWRVPIKNHHRSSFPTSVSSPEDIY
ncbi:MAG TPA: VapE family protein [Saprospiraceae bacterium]|nr:VapE family protein [Saprospiraceae bacterium]